MKDSAWPEAIAWKVREPSSARYGSRLLQTRRCAGKEAFHRSPYVKTVEGSGYILYHFSILSGMRAILPAFVLPGSGKGSKED